jgi:hypothetical protein
MQVFSVDAVDFKSVAFLLGIVLVPAAITFAAVRAAHGRSYLAAWFVVAVGLTATTAILAQLFFLRASVDGSKLTVGGGLYSVTLDRAVIRKEEIRPFATADGYDLGYRTNGIGMPGVAVGWFQPANGKRLFALMTNQTPILIPTTLEYDVVVSPTETERFLSVLKGM